MLPEKKEDDKTLHPRLISVAWKPQDSPTPSAVQLDVNKYVGSKSKAVSPGGGYTSVRVVEYK